MKIKKRFSKEQEIKFLDQEKLINPRYIRWMFLLFIILYTFFALADLMYYPSEWQTLFILRFIVVIPLLILVIFLSYKKSLSKYHQYYISASFFIGGIATAYMLLLHPENIVYYGGLLMVYFPGYLLIKLRFYYATVAGLAIFLFYTIGHFVMNNEFSQIVFFGALFYIGANLIGMLGAYLSEVNSRTQFLHDKEIKEKNDKLKELYSQKVEQLKKLEQSAKENEELTSKNEELARLTHTLKESKERFRILHNASFGGIAVHDKGMILECNQGLSDITGYSIDELTGMDGMLLIAPEYRDFVMNKITDGYEKPYETFGVRKNGDVYPISLEARNMPYEGKQVRAVEFRDLTELKETQKQLENTLEHHELVLNSTESGIYAIDNNGICTYVNENTLKLLGYEDEDEILGKKIHELIHHSYDDGRTHTAKDCPLLRASESEDIINLEDVVWRKDGTYFPVSFSSIAKIEDGKVTGSVVTFYDITERKQYEKELIESNIRFKTLFEKAPLGYQSLDANGCFREVNETWVKLLGYKKEEVIGKFFGDFLTLEYQHAFKERFELFKKLGRIQSEFEMVRKDGSIVFIEFEGLIGYDEHGDFKQTYCTLNDISTRKLMEQERLQKNKELRESEEQYRLLADEMQLGLALHEVICDEQGNPVDYKFISVNKSFENIIGLKSREIIGKTVLQVLPNTEKYWIEKYGEVALKGHSIDFEQFSKELGKYFRVVAYSPKKRQFATIVEDVTVKHNYEESLNYTLRHDVLTGLPNRVFYDEKIIELDQKKNLPLAIIMMDINGLKLINDSMGQKAGDYVLKQVSEILLEEKRDTDFLARISGDEFIMLCPSTSLDYVVKFKQKLNNIISRQRVENIEYSIAIGFAFKEEQSKDIAETVTEAENATYQNKITYGQSIRSSAIESVFSTLTNKYAYEKIHSERVAEYSRMIGKNLGLRDDELDELELAGRLHDIGKIAIDDSILMKPGSLNKQEWDKIKEHTVIGYQILKAADKYSNLAEYAMSHHERIDGKGYPNGIKGKDIPLFARIICVADAFEAMTSTRNYRKALGVQTAIKELKKHSGTQFDAEIVDSFLDILDYQPKKAIAKTDATG